MSKFTKLAKLAIAKDETREFTLEGVTMKEGVDIVLIGKYAGRSNTGYTNAILRANTARGRMKKRQRITAKTLIKNREDDQEIFANHVLVDWKNAFDDEGKVVKFSVDDCLDLLSELPDDIFDEVREFYADPASFREDALSDEDASNLGKH